MEQKKLKFRLKTVVAIPIILLLCLTTAFAQNTIKGTVTDASGKALPNVSVIQQGSKKGTMTDQLGNYSLVLTGNNSVIIFTSVGFETKSETVNGRKSINIILAAQDKSLNEVVVTALGLKKKPEN